MGVLARERDEPRRPREALDVVATELDQPPRGLLGREPVRPAAQRAERLLDRNLVDVVTAQGTPLQYASTLAWMETCVPSTGDLPPNAI